MPKIEIELSEHSYEYYVQSAINNRRTTKDEIELKLEVPEFLVGQTDIVYDMQNRKDPLAKS